MRTLVFVRSWLWPLVGSADYQAGLEAFQRGDFTTALRELRSIAEAGDANAQFNLGIMYYAGKGVPKDDRKAIKMFVLAAEQGHVDAQYVLALSYADQDRD